MQKLQSFLTKNRVWLTLVLIAALGVLVLAWTAWRYLPSAADVSRSEPMQRESDVLTAPLGGDGVRQLIYAGNGDVLYGVELRFHLENRVRPGALHVEVLGPDGAALGSAGMDLALLKEDAYQRILFDAPVKLEVGKAYTLHVYAEASTSGDEPMLWKSKDAMYGTWTLKEGGADAPGTLSLLYVVDYVGGGIAAPFWVLGLLLVAFVTGAWWLLVQKKIKPEMAVLLCGACLGLVFAFGAPLRGAPDEYTHIASCYAKASEMLGQPGWSGYNELMMRPADAVALNAPSSYTALDWKEIYTGLAKGPGENTAMVPVAAKQGGEAFAPLYWAPTLAIFLARAVGLGYVPMLLLGRVFNLALYLFLLWFAVRKMPFGKTTLALLALLPMPLQLAASFSYDGTVIGLAFVYLALCFACAYGEQPVTWKDMLFLAALGALIAPAKTIYILLVPLCFIIPAKRFWQPRFAVWCKIGVVACAAALWLALSWADYRYILSAPDFEAREAQNATAQSEQTQPAQQSVAQQYLSTADESGILPNGDSKYLYTAGYILSHPKQAVSLVLRSLQDNLPLYVQTTLGGRLGEVIVVKLEVSWLCLGGMLLLLLLSLVPRRGLEGMWRYTLGARWWGLLLALGVCALAVAASLTWTPINYEYLFGLQGRYFLPVLPLIVLFFAFGPKSALTTSRELSPYLLYAMCCLDVLALTEVFGQMAVRTLA